MSGAKLEGERFSRLSVLEYAGIQGEKRLWKCLCDCGAVVYAVTGSLRSGNTKSCGCLKRERSTKHGQYKTRTYSLWLAMHNRCRDKQYAKYYWDKSVCERWATYPPFLADMGEVPQGLSLDRIDNSKGYFPDNCRWASRTTQSRNTRRRKEYEHEGIKKSLIEWAEHLGMSHEALRGRIRKGWDFHDAIQRT